MRIRTLSLAIAIIVAAVASAAGTFAWAGATTSRTVVQRVTDPGTGLEIRVEQSKPGDVAVEIGNQTVRIRRQLVAGHVVTIVTTPAETIRFNVQPAMLEVTAGRDHYVVTESHREVSDAVIRRLHDSSALGHAIELLGRVHLGQGSPLGHTLLLARVFLLSVGGYHTQAGEVAREARESLQLVRYLHVGGPTDCWNTYAQEAIAAYTDYVSCMNGTSWYDLIGRTECVTIYDVRALGAFSWWINCLTAPPTATM